MKILIIGASGLLGQSLYFKFSQNFRCIGVWNKNKIPNITGYYIDLLDNNKVIDLLTDLKPDVCIHAAAYSNIEFCQDNRPLATELNTTVTQNIATCSNRIGCRLLFFSTNYVFDGKQKEYVENSPVCPLQIYGKTKAEAEGIVSSFPNNIIIRLSMLYGIDYRRPPQDFIFKTASELLKKQIIFPCDQQVRFPVNTLDVATICEQLTISSQTGIFHISGNTSITKYEWTKHIAKILGVDDGLVQKRPHNNGSERIKRPMEAKLVNSKLSCLEGFKHTNIIDFTSNYLSNFTGA